jgi:hypothetical protein
VSKDFSADAAADAGAHRVMETPTATSQTPAVAAGASLDARAARSRLARVVDLFGPVGLPVLLFALVWMFHPFREVFVFDPDEGNNLIKAMLLANGHPLYTEIWSDQPPLFVHMLRGWLDLTGWTAHHGRVLVLLCSSVLLWALYQSARMTAGHAAAIMACLLLVISHGYLRFSVSVMLGVPSLMFAMLSLCAVLRYHHTRAAVWAVVSGALLALSVSTKMWTGLLVPVVLLAALLPQPPGVARGGRVRSITAWGAGFVTAALLVFLATVPLDGMGQLVRPHLDGWRADDLDHFGGRFWQDLRGDWAILLLGLVGVVGAVRRRAWISLIPAVWAGLALVVLAAHRPLWYHHYLLVSIPMCWAAGIGAGSLFSRRVLTSWRPEGASSVSGLAAPAVTLGLIILAAVSLPGFIDRDFRQPASWPRGQDRYLVAVMEQLKDRTRYVVTDRQMLAFQAGLPVPPELSVTSLKRFRTGHLTTERLIRVLGSYRPEQVILSGRRLPLTPELVDHLEQSHTMIYGSRSSLRFYVANELADLILPALQRAAETVPECWQGHLNLGFLLASVGRHEEAVRAYRRALAVLPDSPVLATVRERLREEFTAETRSHGEEEDDSTRRARRATEKPSAIRDGKKAISD